MTETTKCSHIGYVISRDRQTGADRLTNIWKWNLQQVNSYYCEGCITTMT